MINASDKRLDAWLKTLSRRHELVVRMTLKPAREETVA